MGAEFNGINRGRALRVPDPCKNSKETGWFRIKKINRNGNGSKNIAQDKIYWHDAFSAALQLELHDYEDSLIFEDEHQLSKEALKIDVLIIKKAADIKIEKNIGRIFKHHNILEYKSEKDSLSIWDYNKVAGYAMIYSAFEEIPVENITISFVVTPKPVKLFKHLTKDRGFEISEPHAGIYYVMGDAFAVQIIEGKKLTANENIFLKNLRSSLTQRDMEDLFKAYKKYKSLEKVNIYINRILEANKLIFEEVLAVMEKTVDDIIYEHFKKRGIVDRIREEEQAKAKFNEDRIRKEEQAKAKFNEDRIRKEEQAKTKFNEDRIRKEEQAKVAEKTKRDTAREMLKDGFAPDKVAHYVQMPNEWVQSVMG